jgi:hypothetical protein
MAAFAQSWCGSDGLRTAGDAHRPSSAPFQGSDGKVVEIDQRREAIRPRRTFVSVQSMIA